MLSSQKFLAVATMSISFVFFNEAQAQQLVACRATATAAHERLMVPGELQMLPAARQLLANWVTTGSECLPPSNHTLLAGEVLMDGRQHKADSYGACCQKCHDDDRCNCFVFCDDPSGCLEPNDSQVYPSGSCTLLYQEQLEQPGAQIETRNLGSAVNSSWLAGAPVSPGLGLSPEGYDLFAYADVTGSSNIGICQQDNRRNCYVEGSHQEVAAACDKLSACMGFVAYHNTSTAYLIGSNTYARFLLQLGASIHVSPTSAVYVKGQSLPSNASFIQEVFLPPFNLSSAVDAESGCVMEPNTNYVGFNLDIVTAQSARECCLICDNHPECNEWTYCPNPRNCDNPLGYYVFGYKQCNLKHQPQIDEGNYPFMYSQGDTVTLSSGLPPKVWKKLQGQLKGKSRPNDRQAGSSGCQLKYNSVYGGIEVKNGADNAQDTVEACCQSCREDPQCNLFVYCDNLGGCTDTLNGVKIPPRHCTLKYQAPVSMVSANPKVIGQQTELEAQFGSGQNITFISGMPIRIVSEELPGYVFIGYGDIFTIGDYVLCPEHVVYENAWLGPYCRTAGRNLTAEAAAAICDEIDVCMGFAWLPYGEGNSFEAWTPVAYIKGNVTVEGWQSALKNQFTDNPSIAFYSKSSVAPDESAGVAAGSPPPDASSSTDVALILGLALGIGIPVLVILVVGGTLLYLRRKRTLQSESSTPDIGKDQGPNKPGLQPVSCTTMQAGGDDGEGGQLEPTTSFMPMLSLLRVAEAEDDDWLMDAKTLAWHIKPEEIEICTRPNGEPWVLGRGAFATVYKAMWQGALYVAVKEVQHTVDSKQAMETLANEISILKSCRSPHIVQFLGACLRKDKTIIVTELMGGGTLCKAIGHSVVNWYKRGARIAVDVAQGLHYLHSHNVLHLDIKSANVLLTANGSGKVADVGLAHILQATYAKTGVHMQGTWAWMAPEVITGTKITAKADVYSFGVLLWEIVVGDMPCRGQLHEPRVPEECPQAIADLIQRCLKERPEDRPTMMEVIEQLRLSAPANLASSSSSSIPRSSSTTTTDTETTTTTRQLSVTTSGRSASIPRHNSSPRQPTIQEETSIMRSRASPGADQPTTLCVSPATEATQHHSQQQQDQQDRNHEADILGTGHAENQGGLIPASPVINLPTLEWIPPVDEGQVRASEPSSYMSHAGRKPSTVDLRSSRTASISLQTSSSSAESSSLGSLALSDGLHKGSSSAVPAPLEWGAPSFDKITAEETDKKTTEEIDVQSNSGDMHGGSPPAAVHPSPITLPVLEWGAPAFDDEALPSHGVPPSVDRGIAELDNAEACVVSRSPFSDAPQASAALDWGIPNFDDNDDATGVSAAPMVPQPALPMLDLGAPVFDAPESAPAPEGNSSLKLDMPDFDSALGGADGQKSNNTDSIDKSTGSSSSASKRRWWLSKSK